MTRNWALAVTTAARAEVLPVADFVPGYETSRWYGMCAPDKTPSEIIDKLNTEINASDRQPRHEGAPCRAGGELLPDSPAGFGKLVSEETKKWAKVVRTAGIKPE
jgi:tripartite-type tricarboxylate transporter receptor subunit TctC